jgi:hypothetical protein
MRMNPHIERNLPDGIHGDFDRPTVKLKCMDGDQGHVLLTLEKAALRGNWK